MNIRHGIAVGVVMTLTGTAINVAGVDGSSKHSILDKQGGAIEVRVADSNDKQGRNAIRRQLHDEARNRVPFGSAAMNERKGDIKYRYEKTAYGGRIRIIARTPEALAVVQDFLRSQMRNLTANRAVAFDFIANTSLVVLPVSINNAGPYRFLLDTGASNTILSAAVADRLAIPKRRSQMLLTAGGNLPVTVRLIDTLQVGAARLEKVEIVVTNFPLMNTLNVDGVLGADYLRQFKVSIDYDNQIVEIEPCCPEVMSMFVA